MTKNLVNIPVIAKQPKGHILFQGIAHEVDPHNSYLIPVLKSDENSFSINKETGVYYNFGVRNKLISVYQARNNRRVVIIGSTLMCSNQFYFLSSKSGDAPLKSPNGQLCNDLLLWNFQFSGVLKYENITHKKVYY